jgi:hypothetical protein
MKEFKVPVGIRTNSGEGQVGVLTLRELEDKIILHTDIGNFNISSSKHFSNGNI